MSDSPTKELWGRLARPIDPGQVAKTLLGISANAVTQLADVEMATGVEATNLLDAMPNMLRYLRMGADRVLERSPSGLRGPVLWAETVAARSASFGQTGLYICSVPGRGYDLPENQLLVEALRSLAMAGDRIRVAQSDHEPDARARLARSNTNRAYRFLEHRSLAQVGAPSRSTRSIIRLIQTGRKAALYRPVVDLIEHFAEPLTASDLTPFCDRMTRFHHSVIQAIVDLLESRGRRIPPLRPEGGAFIVGPFEYRHPRGGQTGSEKVGLLLLDHLALVLGGEFDADPSALIDAVAGRRRVAVRTPSEAVSVLESADLHMDDVCLRSEIR